MKNFSGFTKGVNLGGWLSQCDYSKERLDNFITEEDIAVIASWGADHVRIPIDYNVIQNDDGTAKEDGYAYIDHALEMCGMHELNTVIDLHKTAGFSFDKNERELGFFESVKLQERFYAVWEEIARRYGKLSDRVAFELLNEVTDAAFSEVWNRIARECIERIRKIAPDIVILVGSYWNNSINSVKALDKPYDDKIVYNFHCYDPIKFTHQGAPWADGIDINERMTYDESKTDTQYFIDLFKEAAEFAERNGTVLYCGEYGVIDRASPEDALKWFKDINAAFRHYGIGHCAWSYKQMDFGLSDYRMEGVISEIVKYL
jgi:aryl-phospho-beta-D-glucosidase BglC (GH1 family)